MPLVWKSFKHIPSVWLLLVQLVLLVLLPLLNDSMSSHAIAWCLSTLALLLIARIIEMTPIYSGIGMALVLLSLLLSSLVAFGNYMQFQVYANMVEAAAYFYGAVGILLYMFEDEYLTRDELFAAAAVFTLFSWGFALLYSVCQTWYPHSFNLADGQAARSWLELLFLSFSIQSGTGLSDITPLAPAARVLAMLQMLCGVMYLALVVSRLVGLRYVGDHAPYTPPNSAPD